jgi:hypothetical protein
MALTKPSTIMSWVLLPLSIGFLVYIGMLATYSGKLPPELRRLWRGIWRWVAQVAAIVVAGLVVYAIIMGL